MREAKGVESLKEILPKVFKDLEKKRLLEKIETAWRSAAGNKASKHSKVMGFKKGVLTVNADSSMWIYELTLKKNEVLQKLRDKGLKNLKDMRFRIGEFTNEVEQRAERGEDAKRS